MTGSKNADPSTVGRSGSGLASGGGTGREPQTTQELIFTAISVLKNRRPDTRKICNWIHRMYGHPVQAVSDELKRLVEVGELAHVNKKGNTSFRITCNRKVIKFLTLAPELKEQIFQEVYCDGITSEEMVKRHNLSLMDIRSILLSMKPPRPLPTAYKLKTMTDPTTKGLKLEKRREKRKEKREKVVKERMEKKKEKRREKREKVVKERIEKKREKKKEKKEKVEKERIRLKSIKPDKEGFRKLFQVTYKKDPISVVNFGKDF